MSSAGKNELEIVENGDAGDKTLADGNEYSADTLRRMKIVSKTTYKLRAFDDSEMDYVGQIRSKDDMSLELMEFPTSPTHYDQPPTPDHEPPSPFEAETEISRTLDQLRTVRQRNHDRTKYNKLYFFNTLSLFFVICRRPNV